MEDKLYGTTQKKDELPGILGSLGIVPVVQSPAGLMYLYTSTSEVQPVSWEIMDLQTGRVGSLTWTEPSSPNWRQRLWELFKWR